MSVRARVDGSVCLITLDNPPVNGLSFAVRVGLCELLENARQSPDISAVVIHGAGRCFSAGGDIREIGTAFGMAAPGLSSHVHPAIERCGKPVIAALHGLAFGGGLETALACNYRIACADTRIALPEVGLGIIPLSATQRLPRLIGLQGALEMIIGGREQLVGEIGEVTEAVGAGDVPGMIFVHGERWRAEATTAIPRGAHVRVRRVQGLTLHVEQVDGAAAARGH